MKPGTVTLNRLIATEPFETNYVKTVAHQGLKTVSQRTEHTPLVVRFHTDAPLYLAPGDIVFVRGETAMTEAGKRTFDMAPAPLDDKGKPVVETPEQKHARQYILVLEDSLVGLLRVNSKDRRRELPLTDLILP